MNQRFSASKSNTRDNWPKAPASKSCPERLLMVCKRVVPGRSRDRFSEVPFPPAGCVTGVTLVTPNDAGTGLSGGDGLVVPGNGLVGPPSTLEFTTLFV